MDYLINRRETRPVEGLHLVVDADSLGGVDVREYWGVDLTQQEIDDRRAAIAPVIEAEGNAAHTSSVISTRASLVIVVPILMRVLSGDDSQLEEDLESLNLVRGLLCGEE